jgi:hypothetical protein
MVENKLSFHEKFMIAVIVFVFFLIFIKIMFF